MFHLYGPHGPTLLSNGPTSVEVQGRWYVLLIFVAVRHIRPRSSDSTHHRIRDVINLMTSQNIKFIDPTEDASQQWKKHINELSDCTLFPTTRSTYMGGSLPGKAFEQVNYTGGLAHYKEEIRAALPGWRGFRVVGKDGNVKQGLGYQNPAVSMVDEKTEGTAIKGERKDSLTG